VYPMSLVERCPAGLEKDLDEVQTAVMGRLEEQDQVIAQLRRECATLHAQCASLRRLHTERCELAAQIGGALEHMAAGLAEFAIILRVPS